MPDRSNMLVAVLVLVEATGGCGSDGASANVAFSAWGDGMNRTEAGRLIISRAHPDTVFLLPDPTVSDAPLLRSDDAGLSWRSAVPAGAPPWAVSAVVDARDGRFLALVPDYGLVTFD